MYVNKLIFFNAIYLFFFFITIIVLKDLENVEKFGDIFENNEFFFFRIISITIVYFVFGKNYFFNFKNDFNFKNIFSVISFLLFFFFIFIELYDYLNIIFESKNYFFDALFLFVFIFISYIKQSTFNSFKIVNLISFFFFITVWLLVFTFFGLKSLLFFVLLYLVSNVILSTNYIHNIVFLIIQFVLVAFYLLCIFKFDFLAFITLSLYVGGVLILFLTVIKLLGIEKRNIFSFAVFQYELLFMIAFVVAMIYFIFFQLIPVNFGFYFL